MVKWPGIYNSVLLWVLRIKQLQLGRVQSKSTGKKRMHSRQRIHWMKKVDKCQCKTNDFLILCKVTPWLHPVEGMLWVSKWLQKDLSWSECLVWRVKEFLFRHIPFKNLAKVVKFPYLSVYYKDLLCRLWFFIRLAYNTQSIASGTSQSGKYLLRYSIIAFYTPQIF